MVHTRQLDHGFCGKNNNNNKMYVCSVKIILSTIIPSSSMIITVDDEVPRDNDKQLGNNLIAILNVSLSSCIISLMISILNDDDVDPAEMVTSNTSSVDMA